MFNPVVECSACGRRTVATSAGPYTTRIDGREYRYYYVQGHNTPTGQRCPSHHSRPTPVLRAALPAPEELGALDLVTRINRRH